MPKRALRIDAHSFRLLVISLGLGWAAAFPAAALFFRLQLYGDGAMFSYAVAVRDVWAFHWHNVSGRISVLLLTLWPAETIVGITGNPSAGVIAYGFLFYVSPLIGLGATFVADRSPGRIVFVYACGSTALLCPLIFGFPTEMWLAHALFWPALALSHYAKPTAAGALPAFATSLLLAFTHEGALVLLAAIVATQALRGWRNAAFVRAVVRLALILALAAAAKIFVPPDDYYADVFLRAALNFFDPAIFEVQIVLVLLASISAYVAIYLLSSRWFPRQACVCALVIVMGSLAVYWARFDHSLHADSRYYLRTALVLAIPLLGALAAISAMTGEGDGVGAPAGWSLAIVALRNKSLCALASILFVVTMIHLVETGKFVASWVDYRDAVAGLAMNSQSDPALGDPRFVSAERIRPALAALSWFSTVPYLSIILSNYAPNRLVIDPAGNYFWLSCETATKNRDAALAVPVEARELIRVYSCLHRQRRAERPS